MKLNFVLPFLPSRPVGGAKIMFEYANRLAIMGHEVNIFFSVKRPFKKSRTPIWLRYLLQRMRKKNPWFVFHSTVKLKVVKEVTNKNLPDADATISTWWQMAYALNDLSSSKGKKINLIQDYEVWTGQENKVKESYQLPLIHIVIAKYLSKLVNQLSSRIPIHIPNAIDPTKFYVSNPFEERDVKSIIMMYSKEPRKGTQFGLTALYELKKKYPDMKVTLFSVYPRPTEIPEWIIFYHKPDNLRELYNKNSIFFSPSNGEGWALPPAEAMCCGCAVVCTDIGGHHDYAIHEQTALLVEPKNSEAMAEALSRLIEDGKLQNKIAGQALELMKEFSWEKSVQKLESVIKGDLK
jgi:glycosyltransferase involved in cell wall biosynthesis